MAYVGNDPRCDIKISSDQIDFANKEPGERSSTILRQMLYIMNE